MKNLALPVAAAIAIQLVVPSFGHADEATGLIGKMTVVSSATGTQGRLQVSLKSNSGSSMTMCMNGTTAIKEAFVAASSPSINLIQSLLSSALIGGREVSIATQWNGSYCAVVNVSYRG
jgi:hypothetical protein